MRPFQSRLVLLFALFLLTQATEFYVSPSGSSSPCGNFTVPCGSFEDGVNLLHNGDTLVLLPGTYSPVSGNRHVYPTANNITITSLSGAINTIVDFEEEFGPVFVFMRSVNVEGITFTRFNGNATGFVLFSTDNMTIDNCQFLNNTGFIDGENPAGSVSVYNASYVWISNSIFSRNRINSKVDKGYGGAVLLDRISTVLIYNSTFDRGLADVGAGVLIMDAAANVTNCSFTNNIAQYGGDIYIHEVVLVVQDTVFINSSATYGGAIEVTDSAFYCSNCLFKNLKSSFGGAIAIDNNGALASCDNCTFDSCYAYQDGGAVYGDQNSQFECTNSRFLYNEAKGWGGAYSGDYAKAKFINTTFSYNYAEYGGAISSVEHSTIVMNMVNISYNDAWGQGGGVYCSNSKYNITKTEILYNRDNSSSSNLFCSSEPDYTFCTIHGDSYWSSQCGDTTTDSSSDFKLPPLAIVGIALGAAGIVMALILAVVCILWRRELKNERSKAKLLNRSASVSLKARPAVIKKDENMELLDDYDE